METMYLGYKERGLEVITLLTEGAEAESVPTAADLEAWAAFGATYLIVADPMWEVSNTLWDLPAPGFDKFLRPGMKVVMDFPDVDHEKIEKYLPN